MAVRIHPHARERMTERGANEEEVRDAVEAGEQAPAKFGRTGFRRNFAFGREWQEKYYNTKQLEVFAIQEDSDWLVISLIVRYF